MSAIGETQRKFTDEFKAEVVDFCAGRNGQDVHGITATARHYNVDKRQVSDWVHKAGIDPATVAVANKDRNEKLREAAVASRKAQAAAAKERLSRAYLSIAELSAAKQISLLQGNVLDSNGKPNLPPGARLSELVGAGTRALHDYLLLNGDATERTDIRPSLEQMKQKRDELAARRDAKQQQAG